MMLRCWPVLKTINKHHRMRRVRRAAPIIWSCIIIGPPLAAAGIPFFVSSPLISPPAAAMGGIGSGNAPTTAETSPAASRPIPEPSSAVLVVTAVGAAIAFIRGRG